MERWENWVGLVLRSKEKGKSYCCVLEATESLTLKGGISTLGVIHDWIGHNSEQPDLIRPALSRMLAGAPFQLIWFCGSVEDRKNVVLLNNVSKRLYNLSERLKKVSLSLYSLTINKLLMTFSNIQNNTVSITGPKIITSEEHTILLGFWMMVVYVCMHACVCI